MKGPIVTSTAELNPFQGIILENLSLKYNSGEHFALSNISIKIQPGQKIALVGRTGSGKSSIIQALYRFYDVDENSTYLFEGVNALEMPLKELRSHFTSITQKPFIFNATLR